MRTGAQKADRFEVLHWPINNNYTTLKRSNLKEISRMRLAIIFATVVVLAGCSTARVAHYSPYDLNRDGVMDAVCPGMAYDTTKYRYYSWKSDGSKECNEKNETQSSS